MTLFINGQNLTNPYWGVTRVAFELIRAIDTLSLKDDFKAKFGRVILLGREKLSPVNNLKSITYEYLPARNIYIWEHIALSVRTGSHPLLGLQNRNPVLKENCITMLHDAQQLTQKESYSMRETMEGRFMLPLIGRMHRTILTVSNFSAREISRLGIARQDKIKVVYNGIDHQERRSSGENLIKKLQLVPRGYVVAQSSIRHHKNIKNLFEAFARFEVGGLQLVLFGENSKEDFLACGFDVPRNVLFAGLLDDHNMSELVSGALCLALPSLTEGFGLSPLEAMGEGTPTIVSNRGALPEVCGNASIIIDPSNPELWAKKILSLSHDRLLWEKYSLLGLEHSKNFTWSAAAEKIYKVLLERH